MSKVYIGVGSNVGDRMGYLKQAWRRVSALLQGPEHSSLWESAPLIVEDQPPFLNMVFSGAYAGAPESLLDELNRIEAELGRDREKETPKGPRTMDLDILLFGETVQESGRLILPHPAARERAFVLRPLLELMSDDDDAYYSYKDALDVLGDQELSCLQDRRCGGFFLDEEAAS